MKTGYTWKYKLFSRPDSLGFHSRTYTPTTSVTSFLCNLPESLCIYRCKPMYEHHLLTCRLLLFPFLLVTTVASIAQDEPWQNRWHIYAAEGKLGDSDTDCSVLLSSSLPGSFAKVKWWHSDLPPSRLDTTHIWRESEIQIPKRKKKYFLKASGFVIELAFLLCWK